MLAERSVSVVGARSSTGYGDAVASDWGPDSPTGLDRGVGRRVGIDAAAHRGALSVDGATVAVVAGGVDRPYPLVTTTLLARIAEVGAVVAEVAPGMAPTASAVPAAQPLIAAM